MTKDSYVKTLASKNFGIVDEDEQIVEGIVTDDLIDVDGHVIDQLGFKSSLIDYFQWGNIRDQHGLPVGKVLEAPEWNKFVVKIVDDNVWKKIKAGLYKGFSIGIRVLEYEIEEADDYGPDAYRGVPPVIADAIKAGGFIIRITKMVLAEVSVVDRPANPRALITAFKSMNDDDKSKILPVMSIVSKAQEQYEGDLEMPKNIEKDVTENVEDTNVELEQDVNKDAQTDEEVNAEVVDEAVEADADTQEGSLETKFASLETRVNELGDSQNQISKQLGTLTESMVTVSKALETLMETQTAAAEAAVQDEAEVDKAVEDEVSEDAEKDVATDEVKTLDVDSLLAQIDERVKKSVGELLAKRDENKDGHRGGVNLGDSDEDENPVQETQRKATYKDVAVGFAEMIARAQARGAN